MTTETALEQKIKFYTTAYANKDINNLKRISKYERGVLDPPWFVLCAYADVANIWLEALVKDEFDLPKRLPSKNKSAGIKRK
jgi:hypothetical protein